MPKPTDDPEAPIFDAAALAVLHTLQSRLGSKATKAIVERLWARP